MTSLQIEERLTRLEEEMATLKKQATATKHQPALPWWEEIRGTFKNDDAYVEAMRYGREWRESQIMKVEEESDI